jgi:hypothetical protein
MFKIGMLMVIKFIIVDEMMIGYKGSYCPARQYLPQKPQKWGIKVWCLVDSTSKYVYDFEVYYGWNDAQTVLEPPGVEGGLDTHVVLRLVEGLQGKGHVLTTDNYFSSVS